MLLTDEEIFFVMQKRQSEMFSKKEFKTMAGLSFEMDKSVCKAQHQKDIEWLEMYCTHDTPAIPRRKCPICWQEFKEAGH